MSTPPSNFKDTLNLPVTRFEMKANLGVREPQIQQRWRDQDLYAKIREARAGRQRRVLHDGPPYANGDIHMGHLLNKVLKDAVVRFLSLRGFDSPYVPGWDCHGLPIEHTVMKALGSKASGLSASEIREKCRVEALKWVDIQRSQFQRLGIMGDWNHPYLTLDPGYEGSILDVLADLVDGGYVFRQLKPIHWCIQDRTALAEAELEYHDETSLSVYVNFPLVNGVPEGWGAGPWHLMIWTTTPWTLPANVAIAAHPEMVYSGIRYTDPTSGQTIHTILASELVEKVMGLRKVTDWSEIGRCTGAQLEHGQYRHVFLDRTGPIVLADYVTAEDGTGLVHTAPGHGAEDYRTGQTYHLPTLSPVDAGGRYTSEAPEWLVGQGVFQANPKVVDHLREIGVLYHGFSYSHSYPHCWRCKKPVIFRATAQWFISVDHSDLRKRTMRVIAEEVGWMPSWGQSRIEGMVSNRPDWCVSRQRAWGVPIPSLYNEQTDEHHLTAESVRFYRDLFRREGADAWYQKPVADLLPPDLDRERFPLEHLRKGTDILDVWFESGSSHRAVLAQNFELGYPAFLYLEGSDQHRGWFQSSILTAVGSTGRAPFENVLTHGFVVDDAGAKMSKSVGNVIHAVKATEQYGADVLRLYVLSMDYADDVRMSERGIKEASEAYRKIRNTFRFILGNLGDYADFDPASVDLKSLHAIDRWMLGQLNGVIREVTESLERFEFYKAYQRIYQFCAGTLSSVYLDVLKDRLYAERPGGAHRQAAQYVLSRLHHDLAILLAPFIPHTTEEIWEYVPESAGRPASVHLADWPQPDTRWDNAALAATFEKLLIGRGQVSVQIEALRKARNVGSNQEVELIVGYNEFVRACLDNVENLADPSGLNQLEKFLRTFFCVANVVLRAETTDLRADLNLGAGLNLEAKTDLGAETDLRAEKNLTAVFFPWVVARRSSSPKCERCWNLRASVGAHKDNPTLCDRCVGVIQEIGLPGA